MKSTLLVAGLIVGAGCQRDKPADTGNATPQGAATSTPAVALPPTPAVDSAAMARWESIDFATAPVAAAQLKSLTLADVQRVRAILFGRHGRKFENDTVQQWLETRPWYKVDHTFNNTEMTAVERASLDVIREVEAEKHPQIEPGDLRFYQDRVITTAMLGTHPPTDWQVIEAEILANHGFVFATDTSIDSDEDYGKRMLQKYFNARYWYERQPEFQASQLSPLEQANLDSISLAMMRQDKRRLSVGMMHLFASNPLKEELLENQTLDGLRLLRNEVYARHGRVFQTKWIAERFKEYPWYRPRSDFKDSELSAVERANIAMIVVREQRQHEELATQRLDITDVMSLDPGDARLLRNEIYARHGRRFAERGLQSYFASFAWYKPDPRYAESQLTEIERANIAMLRRAELRDFPSG